MPQLLSPLAGPAAAAVSGARIDTVDVGERTRETEKRNEEKLDHDLTVAEDVYKSKSSYDSC